MPKHLDFQRTQLDTVAAQGCVLIGTYWETKESRISASPRQSRSLGDFTFFRRMRILRHSRKSPHKYVYDGTT